MTGIYIALAIVLAAAPSAVLYVKLRRDPLQVTLGWRFSAALYAVFYFMVMGTALYFLPNVGRGFTGFEWCFGILFIGYFVFRILLDCASRHL